MTWENHNMFCCHFCPGFAFNCIIFYSLLVLFSNSSETIRSKGMKGQLCVRLATSFSLTFSSWAWWISHSWLLYQEDNYCRLLLFCCRNFKGHYLQSSHWHKRSFPCNYSSLISVENSEASECKLKSFKYFQTVQSWIFKLELMLNKLFHLQFYPS